MSLSFSLGKCWEFFEHFNKHLPTEQREKRGNDCIVHGFNFGCRANGQRVIPSEQDTDSSILPTQVANHNAGFDSSCPLAEPAI